MKRRIARKIVNKQRRYRLKTTKKAIQLCYPKLLHLMWFRKVDKKEWEKCKNTGCKSIREFVSLL